MFTLLTAMHRSVRNRWGVGLLGLACALGMAALGDCAEPDAAGPAEAESNRPWRPLFDGKTLQGWETLEQFSFKGHGKVSVAEDKRLLLEAGATATGVRFTGKFPRDEYEIRLQAMRTKGQDFFCGLTFPVGKEPCTLIVGGWGGGVIGLSNIDGQSAVENETTSFKELKNDQWYNVRLRVTAGKIEAWLDDERLIDVDRQMKKFSVWWEQEPALPLGIATWYTSAALRNIEWRSLAAVDAAQEEDDGADWVSMFDSETLKGWKVTDFGTASGVEVEDEQIVIAFADGCNGITWQKEFPKVDYEVRLEAMRVDGNDFFCGMTFPVQENPLSLIVGGWGGTVCGLSSIDGKDAARNETRKLVSFRRGQWYDIRLRVTAQRVQAWVDGEALVDQDITGRKLSIRPEVERSRPFGICSWCTTAALRKIRYRTLTAE